MLAALHAYLAGHVTSVLKVDELLRAEWVARVAALDLYVHELVAQRMLRIHAGLLSPTTKYLSFRVSMETQARMLAGAGTPAGLAAFDLSVREQLSYLTFQSPDKIGEAIRLCSPIELWGEVAIFQGASESERQAKAKSIKSTLAAIVSRRNKIAHEADLQPSIPREAWPISAQDLELVRSFIASLVPAIDAVIFAAD